MPSLLRPTAVTLLVFNLCWLAYRLYHSQFDLDVSIGPATASDDTRTLSRIQTQTQRRRPTTGAHHELVLGDDPSIVLSDDDDDAEDDQPFISHTPTLPAYCDACGPNDELCAKYGEAFLARSRAFDGAGARVRRIIRKAQAGEHIKIAVLGGSVTVGRGVQRNERWTELLYEWWTAEFPKSKLSMRNAGVPGTGTAYFSMCFQEHINMDADFVITEFAINDLGREEEMASFEWVLRRTLGMAKQPAVLNMQVFGLEYPRMATGGDYHTAVANYYDTPVISLRNAVLPQIMADPESAPSYFSVTPKGGPDYKHINARMHRAFADILIHYLRAQICTVARRPQTQEDPALERIPQTTLQQRFGKNQLAPVLNPTCASLREARTKLVANTTDGWEITRTTGGNFYVATEPGSRVSFVTRAGVLGQVRITFMRSTMAGLGEVKCWIDNNERDPVLVDGFWWRYVSVIESAVISSKATPGEHTVWCELTAKSNSASGKTTFWIVGVDGA
ncbi:hypothetical protein EXIGLDRAFT_722676 [Exidia glandulosa HHB12029]|uniref:SGNH hydrolase-type esterase domain-containing protein n=1 Tax=Exidia glandulosa HHB12029 TaxID=1314781 RepID=A0A165F601_EXIGL|nr:hypothetical protein EXIGLDRAFT_722676 [Exidia glandulosa HHB12029]